MNIISVLQLAVALAVVAVIAQIVIRYRQTGFLPSYAYRRIEGDEGSEPTLRPQFNVPTTAIVALVVLILVIVTVSNAIAVVPPAHRGVLMRLGELQDMSYPEGLKWKRPFLDRYVMVPIYAYSAHITESTASSDMQEITTQLSVQYQIIPNRAHEVYRNYRFDWEIIQIKPIIFEEMKATTADWTAEQLIQERPLVMAQLRDQLTHRFEPLGFQVISVNIEDLQFSPEYWDAIEQKAVATQLALAEKNILEVVRYQQQQNILKEEAAYNITLIQANAFRERQIREAEGQAQATVLNFNASATGILLEYTATADGIALVKEELTGDFLTYEMLKEWDGKLPLIIGADGSLFLDIRALMPENQ